jgi:hypothetical protein
MTTDREVMQQALERLALYHAALAGEAAQALALRARLAEPETCKPALQVEEVEPVAWRFRLPSGKQWHFTEHRPHEYTKRGLHFEPLYTAPPARRPLTDEEIWDIAGNCLDSVAGRLLFARAIERAHKIGVNDD